MLLNFSKFIKFVLSITFFGNNGIVLATEPIELSGAEKQISRLMSLPGVQEDNREAISSASKKICSIDLEEIVNCATETMKIIEECSRGSILPDLLTALDKVGFSGRASVLKSMEKIEEGDEGEAIKPFKILDIPQFKLMLKLLEKEWNSWLFGLVLDTEKRSQKALFSIKANPFLQSQSGQLITLDGISLYKSGGIADVLMDVYAPLITRATFRYGFKFHMPAEERLEMFVENTLKIVGHVHVNIKEEALFKVMYCLKCLTPAEQAVIAERFTICSTPLTELSEINRILYDREVAFPGTALSA